MGAARDALMQVLERSNNLNVGGKIGLVRMGNDLAVCIYVSIGLLHLNEFAIGIGHQNPLSNCNRKIRWQTISNLSYKILFYFVFN